MAQKLGRGSEPSSPDSKPTGLFLILSNDPIEIISLRVASNRSFDHLLTDYMVVYNEIGPDRGLLFFVHAGQMATFLYECMR